MSATVAIERATTAEDVSPERFRNVYRASAIGRTGDQFAALCEYDEDGLSIATRQANGSASAHRRIAREYFGVPVERVLDTSYMSSVGEVMALTTWVPKPGRTPVNRD
ncbi:hypothetical protein [Nocardia sp. NPDC005825]|uniref:hypothetical protein n=1 Tax=unclassified Nocardia TaxID=2637762 RepID=UPI0033ED9706